MIALVLATCLAQAPQVSEWTHLPDRWDAHLASPGGELPFGLVLGVDRSGATTARITNASEQLEVPVVRWSRERLELVLGFPHYDSQIVATASPDGATLSGVWRKRKGADAWSELRFEARQGSRTRTPLAPTAAIPPSPLRDAIYDAGKSNLGFYGTWRALFASDPTPCVARFEGPFAWEEEDEYGGDFAGTFLTTLGDYRYLSGAHDLARNRVTLSCFDGAHAFLFSAKMLDDGSLVGDFWSGDSWHETWTAVRDESATLPDPFGLTKTVDGVSLDELAFPDVDGTPRKLGDPQFAGQARIVQLFGTWCPNCNDETRYLRELDERFRGRGLSIVGLAFEVTGDFQRDAQQVRTYAKHHQITYPVLVAGVADKQKASERFPLLDRVRAFPTTLFVDAAGRVRAVHQGFSGPATGAEHHKLREDFERLVEGLLAEGK